MKYGSELKGTINRLFQHPCTWFECLVLPGLLVILGTYILRPQIHVAEASKGPSGSNHLFLTLYLEHQGSLLGFAKLY